MKRDEWEKLNRYEKRHILDKSCCFCRHSKTIRGKIACTALEAETGAIRVNKKYVCKQFI